MFEEGKAHLVDHWSFLICKVIQPLFPLLTLSMILSSIRSTENKEYATAVWPHWGYAGLIALVYTERSNQIKVQAFKAFHF